VSALSLNNGNDHASSAKLQRQRQKTQKAETCMGGFQTRQKGLRLRAQSPLSHNDNTYTLTFFVYRLRKKFIIDKQKAVRL
jgi:hypothetical protein